MLTIDKPVDVKVATLSQAFACVEHPAFRIGFLDARESRPIDHDTIMRRIAAETPTGALKRIQWPWSAYPMTDVPLTLFEIGPDPVAKRLAAVALAQWRYEEGRVLFLEHGIRCKAWGHPDYPPAQVRQFCIDWVNKQREESDGNSRSAEEPSLRP